MVTRTFRTSDGRANASVTVEGSPQHRVRVTINGEEVEFAAEDRTAPGDAAPSAGNGWAAADAAAVVSVQVTTASSTSGTASTHVSSFTRAAHRGASRGAFADMRRRR